MSVFDKFFTWVKAAFSNPRVEAAFRTADQIAEELEPVVKEINALVPNKTVTEVLAAYDKFGVPVVKGFSGDDPAVVGAMLLNLGTGIAQKKFPNVPASVIQTGLQAALLVIKSNTPPPVN